MNNGDHTILTLLPDRCLDLGISRLVDSARSFIEDYNKTLSK